MVVKRDELCLQCPEEEKDLQGGLLRDNSDDSSKVADPWVCLVSVRLGLLAQVESAGGVH